MPARRTWTDEQLVVAVPKATSWSQICEILGLSPNQSITRVKNRAGVLGLDTGHFYSRHLAAESVASPFQNKAQRRFLRTAAVGIATAWFLRRGYMVSIPIEQAPYDLVAESDVGLQRIQVKTSTGKVNHGGSQVDIGRHLYDPESGGNRHARYAEGDIDAFFIVTAAGRLYLIPHGVVMGLRNLTLDKKYAEFEVTTE